MEEPPAKTTIPLRFGQWHLWTHTTVPTTDTKTNAYQQLVFCLPPVEGQVAWARNHFPLMQQDVYALEYDERIGMETMQSLCKYLALEVSRILEYHRCIHYSLMGYSMGSALAYGLMQSMDANLKPKCVMFIDSSPVVLFMIKDLVPPTPEPVPEDPQARREYEISKQAEKVLRTMTKVDPVAETSNRPRLLLVKAKDHPDKMPILIPEDYGMSQIIATFEMRTMRGTHQSVNKESCVEIVSFFEEFSKGPDRDAPPQLLLPWMLDKLQVLFA